MDPITTAALQALNLKSDRLPSVRWQLADLVAERNPPESWTDDKTAAYRHLCGVVPLRRPPAPKPTRVGAQAA